MTPQSGLNKTAPAAVLDGSMFSKPCAPAQKRVPCTRAAAQAAALGLLYHISKLALRVPLVLTKKHGIYAAKLMLRLRLAFANRTYYTTAPLSAALSQPHLLRFSPVSSFLHLNNLSFKSCHFAKVEYNSIESIFHIIIDEVFCRDYMLNRLQEGIFTVC